MNNTAMNNTATSSPEVRDRAYQVGDEVSIMDLLNLRIGVAFNLEKWKWRYVDFPVFQKEDILIIESGEKMVGHRGLFQRDLCIGDSRVPSVTFGDTIVHPDFRGRGIYRQIWKLSMEKARSRGFCINLGSQIKDSPPNRLAIRKLGFMEVPQFMYVKILNPARAFKAYLKVWMRTNPNREMFEELKNYVFFDVEGHSFYLGELESEEFTPKKSTVKITIKESAMPLLVRFKMGRKLERIKCLLLLLLSRKMKVKFTSLGIMLRFAKLGVKVIV